MTYDTVVIGAGLAGLTAALRLAEEGRRVLVVAKGVGSTHLSPATIDVLGFDDGAVERPAQALSSFAEAHPEHPYARLSMELIAASTEWLKTRLPTLGYRGGLEENFLLPTAVGAVKRSALVPETMAGGDLRRGEEVQNQTPVIRTAVTTLASIRPNALRIATLSRYSGYTHATTH